MTKMTLTQIKNSLANAHIWEPNIRAALAAAMRDAGAQNIVQTVGGTTRGEVSGRAKGRFVGTFPQLMADAAAVRATVDSSDKSVGARKYAAMVEAAEWLEERVNSYINAYARNNRVEIVAEEPAAPVTPVTTTPETETKTMTTTNDTHILRAAALLAYVAAHHADDTVDNDLVKRALKRGDADAADQYLAGVSVDLSYTAPRATMLAQLALLALRDNEPTVYGVLVDAMDDACLPAYEDAEYTLRYDALEEQGHPLPAGYTWDDVRGSVDAAYEEAVFTLREAELREAAREAVRAAEIATTRAREVLEALCAEAGADA